MRNLRTRRRVLRFLAPGGGMDLDRLERDVERFFTEERVGALVEAHRSAYDRAALHHSPEDGADAQLFGFTNYKYITHRLVQLPPRLELGFELRSAHPALRLGLGPFTLGSYPCGSSGDQDIWESFPNNDAGAPALADLNQLCLALDFSQAVPRALVLAHFGNPEHGLEAIHLAAPGSKEDGRISGWSWTRELWRCSRSDSAEPSLLRPDLPRPVRIEPAALILKIPAEQTQATSDR
jgi:hypothetical protein